MRRWIVAGATDHSTPRLRISSRIDRSRNTRKKAAAYRISCADTRQQLFPLSDRPKFRALIVENVKCTLIPAAIFRTIIHVYIYIYTSYIQRVFSLSFEANRIDETYQNVDGYLCRRFRESHHGHHVHGCRAAREDDAEG